MAIDGIAHAPYRSGRRDPRAPWRGGWVVNEERPHRGGVFPEWLSGGVLLSHTLSGAVPSALWVLASGFGMGPGVSPTL